nr:aminomethyl-transferring glycine dehydrogenase [Actinomycetales bacterium]
MTFLHRHVGTLGAGAATMCEQLGVASPEALLRAAVPASIFEEEPAAGLPGPADEAEVLAELRAMAARNRVRTSLIGQGYYDTVTPSVIRRNVLENPSWYTAYTPYQPEISQGRLEALLNFQTTVADLTGLPVSGASLLDEGTAAAEAMLLMRRASRVRGNRFVIDADLFGQTRAVLATRAAAVGVELVAADLAAGVPDLTGVFGVLAQQFGATGRLLAAERITALAEAAHESGALLGVVADLLAATLVTSPGELGADVVCGTTQRFGIPMGFGGPHAGYMSVRESYTRQLPGRLVGVSKDAEGRPALRLALQTREQHIRREKATSNICTAQVLLAVMASMYAVWHGPDGLTAIARRVHDHARSLATRLTDAGLAVRNGTFFDTVSVAVASADDALAALLERNVTAWRASETEISLAVDETTTGAVVDAVVTALEGHGTREGGAAVVGIPAEDARTSAFLTHPTFHRYRSETAMMRYLRRLASQDYALDRGMIPLGSCTMKLNSAIEMAAITWPGFARIHPFAPTADVEGYRELIGSLTGWLAAITGYDTGSLQPNSGAQGELAGLLAIRGYHRSRGEEDRDLCLIPSSAHGTNAASAVLAGLRVAVVGTDNHGNVDVEDLRATVAANEGRVAAIMITYPSTHGVYEVAVREVCQIVHDAGGQVYVDGANMNALVGVARPGAFGGDVSHLNLHKTFAIPHGGGGPGVGPVVSKGHLAPFLPGHPFDPLGERPDGAISAAPHGSASILPISWAYIRLLGAKGLREATAAAVLAANYLAARIGEELPILYRGAEGWVAHECIVDLREMRAKTGITVDDVAKRLIDHGFHAPTMSFPVAGTLMVEPTESENLEELDRFADAMLQIRVEAQQVADGFWPAEDNPLVNAPHTARHVTADAWDHPYTRQVAAYPWTGSGQAGEEAGESEAAIADKYWPPVRRIDGAWGDRNLACTCPAPEAFAQQ